jgi:phage regulator Rha-like protein
MNNNVFPTEAVISKILLIRDQKVMLDSDLAKLYGVETKKLNQQVKRNINRFPNDFMFQINEEEFRSLKSQSVTSKEKGGRRYLPYAFTEHGVAMLSSILNSDKAIQANIFIIRAFIKLRELISTHKDVQKKLKSIEDKLNLHEDKIIQIIRIINQFTAPPDKQKRKLGF